MGAGMGGGMGGMMGGNMGPGWGPEPMMQGMDTVLAWTTCVLSGQGSAQSGACGASSRFTEAVPTLA